MKIEGLDMDTDFIQKKLIQIMDSITETRGQNVKKYYAISSA
jgi:hypothetical protein